jgi:hypothetical protein
MNWTNGISWFSALRAVRVTRPANVFDNAEMGTAFGLEASMVEPEGDDSPIWKSASTPAAAEVWERRIVRRSGL